ncbi:hypothetical protein [Xylanimonas protaetiae]|uniref:Uncharacterized protein n=1 Tax=Xylanimonas protaetiae TaxID=2509457 RepID=A0A4P6F399_9MICO|nr:hypothetical protein [Xylanimonas protaetiae]QAY69756.1 hypothetical protein ET471_06625 [Xylanimonas protaetiae]
MPALLHSTNATPDKLDLGTVVALAALAVAIIAIPIAVFATRRWGSRRAKISVVSDAISLLPEATSGLVEVTFRGIPVNEPHLVTVVIANIGPRDVSSEMFDRGRPIIIRFDAMFFGLTQRDAALKTVSAGVGATGDDAQVAIRPSLLKRGATWSFSVIVAGPANVQVDAPLVDTDITTGHGAPELRDVVLAAANVAVRGILRF